MNVPLKAIYYSLIPIFLWSITDVGGRYFYVVWGADPVILTSYVCYASALALLFIAGPGPLAAETLRQPHTWAFSFLMILQEAFFIFSTAYLATTEISLLFRMNIILALVGAWVFLKRTPRRVDVLAVFMIAAGCALILSNTPAADAAIVFAFLFLASICRAAQSLVTETHPTSREAKSIKDNCRVTGYVMLVTSFSFLIILLLLAATKWFAGNDEAIWTFLPEFGDLFNSVTLIAGFILGIFVGAPAMYFFFLANKVGNSETYLAVNAFAPVTVLFFEGLANYFGLLDISTIKADDAIAGALIMGGAFMMVWVRHRSKAKQKEAQEPLTV